MFPKIEARDESNNKVEANEQRRRLILCASKDPQHIEHNAGNPAPVIFPLIAVISSTMSCFRMDTSTECCVMSPVLEMELLGKIPQYGRNGLPLRH